MDYTGILLFVCLTIVIVRYIHQNQSGSTSATDENNIQQFCKQLVDYENDGRNITLRNALLKSISEQRILDELNRDRIFGARFHPRGQAPSERMTAFMEQAFTKFLENEYNAALKTLKENPTSADAHQQTLSLGREYAAAAREGGKVTIFDETALANDIRAATANASQIQKSPETPATPQATSSTSLKERIAALTLMKESGLLSDEEFDRKRREILDQI